MTTRTIIRYVAAPAFLVALGSIANCSTLDNAACPEFSSADFGASLDIDARAKVFMEASGRFKALGETMVSDVATACVNIATAAGGDSSKWAGKDGSDKVDAACAEASAALTAVFQANANVTVDLEITGGHCDASFDAQAQCNAKCDVSGKCTMAQLQAQCEPGKLAGTCSGMCTGSCDASAGVMCTGSCSAECDGACMGTCNAKDSMGNCAGKCGGTCMGTCKGTCQASGSIMCTGQCEGSCSVAFQAPHCEGKFQPPMCSVDADCEASCQASVQAQASCTPPSVKYVVNGSADAKLMATVTALETEIPKLIVVAQERGQAAVDLVGGLAQAGANLKGAVSSSAKAAACIGVAVEASAAAALNVKASFSASVSVSGSAKVGG